MFGDVTFAQAPFAALGGNTLSSAVFETVAATPLPSADITKGGIQTEVAVAEAAPAAVAVFPVGLAEGVTGDASVERSITRVATVAESVAASAAVSAIRQANVYPSGVQLLININGVLVWAVIDDTQNPNWQNIVNAQGSGWTVISDTQTPGWTQIPS